MSDSDGEPCLRRPLWPLMNSPAPEKEPVGGPGAGSHGVGAGGRAGRAQQRSERSTGQPVIEGAGIDWAGVEVRELRVARMQRRDFGFGPGAGGGIVRPLAPDQIAHVRRIVRVVRHRREATVVPPGERPQGLACRPMLAHRREGERGFRRWRRG